MITKRKFDKALLMTRGFNEEMADIISRSVNSHDELVELARKFHGDWRGNGQNHQPLERIGFCWCCDLIGRAEGVGL